MYSGRYVDVFRSETWRNVNEFAVSMETEYAKTKSNKSLKNFVHVPQFAVRKEMILENISSKSICLLNHNIQVFGQAFWSRRLTEER